MTEIRATTIVGVRLNGVTAIAADGQVTMGDAIVKNTSKKILRLHNGKVIVGFAGAVADAQTLADRLESKLEEYHGNLPRAAVELAKEWRIDKYLRRLESMLIAADTTNLLLISGSGEIIQPDGDVAAIGSGGGYALAAARVLLKHTKMSAEEVVKEALLTAAGICVYTNTNVTVETVS